MSSRSGLRKARGLSCWHLNLNLRRLGYIGDVILRGWCGVDWFGLVPRIFKLLDQSFRFIFFYVLIFHRSRSCRAAILNIQTLTSITVVHSELFRLTW